MESSTKVKTPNSRYQFFFDDFVLVVTAPSPQELVQKCARVLSNTGKAFASRGMEVNDNRGKTEAFLEFYGTGAAKVKHDTLQGNQQIHADHSLFGELDIGITHQYKHLGSINAGPHKYDQEVESRSAQAKATSNALRGKQITEKRFAQDTKTNSLESACAVQTHLPRSNTGYHDS